MRAVCENWLSRIWYGMSAAYIPLLPFSWIFKYAAGARRFLYKKKLLKAYKVGVPVIIVGNISVGGTGKTPAAVWLAEQLKYSGKIPGIISRGYPGHVGKLPVVVRPDSDPAIVGDEAILMATRTGCRVVVHPNRAAAARKVIELGANIIISDDGLQHYRLARDFEIVVMDTSRGFGNGKLLPAGPLREPVSRLHSVDMVLVNCENFKPEVSQFENSSTWAFQLTATSVHRLDESETRELQDFSGKRVHAVAGIGHPERFFRMLQELGIDAVPHPLSDHADIGVADITFADDLDVLMTEKDAVKCRQFNTDKCWYVAADFHIKNSDPTQPIDLILSKISQRKATI